jgi:hypothetical protein
MDISIILIRGLAIPVLTIMMIMSLTPVDDGKEQSKKGATTTKKSVSCA